jgi:hypothetical protein
MQKKNLHFFIYSYFSNYAQNDNATYVIAITTNQGLPHDYVTQQ